MKTDRTLGALAVLTTVLGVLGGYGTAGGATESVSQRPAEVEIVRGQRALACVVLNPDAHQLEKEAAADLRWAVKEATGVALEVCQAPAALGAGGGIE